MQRFSGRWWAGAVLSASLCVAGMVQAHVVPNMTVEADFSPAGGYTLRINVDPRTFLASDPTTLPPVPGSWYREQTPEQVTATHDKARLYLRSALGLLFSGRKMRLPDCQIQAMDGADNTPLKPETLEVHLLAIVQGRLPEGAGSFQVDFAKDANTSMILLLSQEGKMEPRPQVVFPGETSRPFLLKTPLPEKPPGPKTPEAGQFYLTLVTAAAGIAGFTGWRLLKRYRHHHRAHRRGRDGGM